MMTLQALNALATSHVCGTLLHLPKGHLPSPVYKEVNDLIRQAGGKWDRQALAHRFPVGSDPCALMEQVVREAEPSLPAGGA